MNFVASTEMASNCKLHHTRGTSSKDSCMTCYDFTATSVHPGTKYALVSLITSEPLLGIAEDLLRLDLEL